MALTPETVETTVDPEPVVERIVHAPIESAPPAPGADAKSPEPVATDETAQEAPAAETTEPSEEQKQSKFQRRLDRQKAARYQAEAEARVLREERDRLRAHLEGQARQNQAPDTGEPKREQFEDYEAYLRAATRWEADQATDKRLKAEREAYQRQQGETQVRQEREKLAKTWIERETAFKAATKDYEEKANEFLDEGGEKLTSEARELIIDSEVGPQLLYHLANHPEDAERIAELSPRRQLIELGKLEDKVSPGSNGKKTTNAPRPASTVRQGANSADGLRENMSQAEVAAYMKSHGSRWVR